MIIEGFAANFLTGSLVNLATEVSKGVFKKFKKDDIEKIYYKAFMKSLQDYYRDRADDYSQEVIKRILDNAKGKSFEIIALLSKKTGGFEKIFNVFESEQVREDFSQDLVQQWNIKDREEKLVAQIISQSLEDFHKVSFMMMSDDEKLYQMYQKAIIDKKELFVLFNNLFEESKEFSTEISNQIKHKIDELKIHNLSEEIKNLRVMISDILDNSSNSSKQRNLDMLAYVYNAVRKIAKERVKRFKLIEIDIINKYEAEQVAKEIEILINTFDKIDNKVFPVEVTNNYAEFHVYLSKIYNTLIEVKNSKLFPKAAAKDINDFLAKLSMNYDRICLSGCLGLSPEQRIRT